MNNLDKALAELATKLGTSVEKLWPLLVAREQMEGIIGVTLGVIFLLGIVLVAKKVNAYTMDHDKPFVCVTAATLLLLPLLGIVKYLPSVFYPEVDAISRILGVCK